MYRNVNELTDLFCDDKRLAGFLDPHGEQKYNVTTARTILCSSDTAEVLQKIINEMDVSEIEELVSVLIFFL